jgi:protein TonB
MSAAHRLLAHRPLWATGASVFVHLAVLAALTTLAAPQRQPATLPQIELLPPLPVQPTPQDARPSPINLPVSTEPTLAAAFSPPVPVADPPRVIASSSDVAPLPLPPPHKPLDKRKERPQPQPIPTKTIEHSLSPPTAAPINGNEAKDKTVVAEAPANPTPAGPPPSYIGLIQARLLQVKQYPADARLNRQEGTVTMRFTIDRAGHVLSSHLQQSSGVRSLDDEATAMIARASPFPPMPPSPAGSTLALVVPIEFSLKAP